MAPRLALEERAVRQVKFMDLTFWQLADAIDKQRDVKVTLRTKPRLGKLKIQIRCRSNVPEAWTMALILNNTPVDWIDHHGRYVDRHGLLQHGWHHHVWDAQSKSSKNGRERLDGFVPLTAQEFIISGLACLNVFLETGGPLDGVKIV